MGRIGTLLLGVILGGAGIYTALFHHVVRSKDGFELIAKSDASLTDTYVDIRQFRVQDWAEHRELALAVITAKKDHLMGDAGNNSMVEKVEHVIDQWRR